VRFPIAMADKTIHFRDIFKLSDAQKRKIIDTAPQDTQRGWRNRDTGIKVELEDDQPDHVLNEKNTRTIGKDEITLYDENIVELTKHARERISERIDGRADKNRRPKSESMYKIISLIKESDMVHPEAEWKGHPRLTYTVTYSKEERFDISISFRKRGHKQVVVVTVTDDLQPLKEQIMDKPGMMEQLEAFKLALLKDYEENEE